MHSRTFRVVFGAFSLAFFAGAPSAVFADDAAKAHVAVIRFANETGSASYDAACRAATDTLILSLRQVGKYLVQPEEYKDRSDEGLRALAADRRLDFIMYGRMSKPESGGIACSLSVYDRAKGKTALSHTEKASGVMDIFDATDALVVSVLESMTGAHIGFGAVKLKNSGEKGGYTVLVDGSPAGDDLGSLERVLIGRRTVTILQRRMLGDREIAKESMNVKEGQELEIEFALPYLMDDEKAKVESLKSAIEAGWNDEAKAGPVDAATAELSSLLKDISYSPKLATIRDEAKQQSGMWAVRKDRFQIENSAWDPKLELPDSGSAVYLGAKGYPDPGRIKKAFEDNARLVQTLFELKAGMALGNGDIDLGLQCFGNALMVSIRYLGGDRLTDYAYAVTILKELQDMAGTSNAAAKDDRNLKLVFGDFIRAGQRFYAIKASVAAGTAAAVVGSDFTKTLSVDGGAFVDAPFSTQPGSRTIRIQPKGDGNPILLTAVAKAKILFIQDGFAAFGKIALGSAPGTLEVNAATEYNFLNTDGTAIFASLDGGDEVELPHVFDNVSSGSHTVKIPNVLIGNKLYAGLEENVTIEPGKRLYFGPRLTRGSGTLHVDGIPEGSTLLIDGDEQAIAKDPAGGLVFDGIVDSGYPRIEVVNGSKNWDDEAYVAVGGSRSISVKKMSLKYILQRKTIKLKGKEEDWAGVEPIFGPAENFRPLKISGSSIAGGYVCRDETNIYIRVDFSDGKPDISYRGCVRLLDLYQLGQHINLEINVYPDGTAHSGMWVEKTGRMQEAGSYAIGPSFVEMQFKLSLFSKLFDFSKPIYANLRFWTTFSYSNDSPRIVISIGDYGKSKQPKP